MILKETHFFLNIIEAGKYRIQGSVTVQFIFSIFIFLYLVSLVSRPFLLNDPMVEKWKQEGKRTEEWIHLYDKPTLQRTCFNNGIIPLVRTGPSRLSSLFLILISQLLVSLHKKFPALELTNHQRVAASHQTSTPTSTSQMQTQH